MLSSKKLGAVGVASMFTVGLLAGPALATDADTSVGVTHGDLTFSTDPALSLSTVTLDGTNKTATGNLTFTVDDATGSGTGWKVAVTSTTFTGSSDTGHTSDPGSGKTLSKQAATATPTAGHTENACASGVTCTQATNAVTSFTVPADATAPTAAPVYNAAAATGLAKDAVTIPVSVAVPANTYEASYLSTWTLTLSSGPS